MIKNLLLHSAWATKA